jgi:hypothetical protein
MIEKFTFRNVYEVDEDNLGESLKDALQTNLQVKALECLTLMVQDLQAQIVELRTEVEAKATPRAKTVKAETGE